MTFKEKMPPASLKQLLFYEKTVLISKKRYSFAKKPISE